MTGPRPSLLCLLGCFVKPMMFKHHIYADVFQFYISSPELVFQFNLKCPTTYYHRHSSRNKSKVEPFIFPLKVVSLALISSPFTSRSFLLPFCMCACFFFFFNLIHSYLSFTPLISSNKNFFFAYHLSTPQIRVSCPASALPQLPATFRVALTTWYWNGCVLVCLSDQNLLERD